MEGESGRNNAQIKQQPIIKIQDFEEGTLLPSSLSTQQQPLIQRTFISHSQVPPQLPRPSMPQQQLQMVYVDAGAKQNIRHSVDVLAGEGRQSRQTQVRRQFTEVSSSSSSSPPQSSDDSMDGGRGDRLLDLDGEGDMESEDDYFESSSQSSGASLDPGIHRGLDKLFSLDPNSMNEPGSKLRHLLFQNPGGSIGKNDPLGGKIVFQLNAEELHRQELGGVVVYDSFARIIGNSHLINYYEANPPKKGEINRLFDRPEIARADKLFYKEPRERDFQNDFDKFLFKHLPKFAPQREFNLQGGSGHGGTFGGQPQHTYTINVPQQENILIFDSRFENANLRRAIKVNNVEYNLWLENDVNTKGHTQWFYFKVIHQHPKSQKIQFNILNLAKPQSLYQLGMKPCIYSKKHNKLYGKEWFRGGEDVKYFQNEIPRKSNHTHGNGNNQFLYNNNGAGEGLEYYFTLSFIYEFAEDEDEVWFAQAIPYSYGDLQKDLISMQDKADGKNMLSFNILCKELTGQPCPLVTITDNVDTYLDYYDQVQLNKELPNVVRKQFHKKYMKSKKLYKQSLESKGKVRRLLNAAFEEEINSFYENNADIFKSIDDAHNMVGEGAAFGRRYDNFHTKLKQYIIDHFHKKAIVITSRVHPGEPQSSYMMQGMLDYLVSDEAAELRKNFVFRIVPMLNVDGVVYGNQRCSLLGVDLNRRWVNPNVFLHPTIYHSKWLIRTMHSERRVLMYCDMHGHSRKQNAFFYGCTYKNYEHEGRIKNAQLRMMPLLCCHKSPGFYKFSDCRFRIEKCKESTARVVIFREFNIMNAFTLESSFFGKEPDPIVSEESGESTNRQVINKQGTHFSIQDLKIIGQTLIQVINNYLPREQSKLELLSGKILDIFYEEFVKLIPPFVLKREEERKRQLIGLEQQQLVVQTNQLTNQTSYAMPLAYGKSPTAAVQIRGPLSTSPRISLGSNGVISSVLQNNPPLMKMSTLRKKTQNPNAPPTEQTPLANRKLVRLQNFPPTIQMTQVTPVTTVVGIPNNKRQSNTSKKRRMTIKKESTEKVEVEDGIQTKGSGTEETDTFSQLINIHQNQEELLDFESFIKGENVKMKILKQSQMQVSGQIIMENDEEDDQMDAGSDSSADSDESAKNLFVQEQQSLQSKQITKGLSRKGQKKSGKKNREEEDVMRSIEGSKGVFQNRSK